MGGYDEEALEDESTDSSSTGVSSPTSGDSSPLRQKSIVSPTGQPLRPIAGNTLLEIIAGGIAGASVATSVVAMILQPANIVFVAGGLSW